MAKFMKTSSATNATLLDTTLLNVPSQSEAFNLFNLTFHLFPRALPPMTLPLKQISIKSSLEIVAKR